MAMPWEKNYGQAPTVDQPVVAAPTVTPEATMQQPTQQLTEVPLGYSEAELAQMRASGMDIPEGNVPASMRAQSELQAKARQHMSDLYSPDSKLDPLSRGFQGFADFARMVNKGWSLGGTEWLKAGFNKEQALANMAEVNALQEAYGTAGKVDELTGTALGAMLTPGAALSSGLKATLTGGLEGGLTSLASSYFNTGEVGTPAELAVGTILGAVLGAGGYQLGKVFTKPLIEKKVVADQVDELNKLGVDVRIGQITHDPKQLALEAGASGVAQADQLAKTQFSRGVLDRANIITKDGLLDTTALTSGFDNVGRKMTAFANQNPISGPDGVRAIGKMIFNARQLMQDLVGTQSKVGQVYPNPNIPQPVYKAFHEILKGQRKGGLTGAEFQSLTSELAEAARKNPTQADSIYAMRSILDDGYEAFIAKANPGEEEVLKGLRKQWVGLLTMEHAFGAAGTDAARGYITPANLESAVKTISGKKGYTRETNDFAKAARAGVSLLVPAKVATASNSREVAKMLGTRLSTAAMMNTGISQALGSSQASIPAMAAGTAGLLLPDALAAVKGRLAIRPINAPRRFHS